jgi:hypothetical protein
MSSSLVRKSSKNVANQVAAAEPDWKFYDTVNIDQDPIDDKWFTIEYNSEHTEMSTFCGESEETGLIDLIFNCPGGDGDDVIEECERIAKAFINIGQSLKLKNLSFTRMVAPEGFNHSTTRYFQVIIGVEYKFVF